MKKGELRHNWRAEEVVALLQQPFNDLIFHAQSIHRRHFDANVMQFSTLLNIKRGGCPEDCAYCPQSVRYDTGVKKEGLLPLSEVVQAARMAKRTGATRFCMGAAWRSPKEKDFTAVLEMVNAVKAEGLESCLTVGMLDDSQANRLKQAGLDFYNHNIDCSESFYKTIISTREYRDRLETLARVRAAGIKVCSGGIIGMGESVVDRAEMLCVLANMATHPDSVPINLLVRAQGTPLADAKATDPFDLVRIVASARIVMPKSVIRLSAGRNSMDEALQALCFLAGANSIFYGEALLTTDNPSVANDSAFLQKLGIVPRC